MQGDRVCTVHAIQPCMECKHAYGDTIVTYVAGEEPLKWQGGGMNNHLSVVTAAVYTVQYGVHPSLMGGGCTVTETSELL